MWIDRDLRQRFYRASSLRERIWLATAGLLNLTLWLGWLRSTEALSLRWCDVQCIPPHRSAEADLPSGLGALTLRLSPATKASRTRTVDVIIAYQSRSGLSIGWWYDRLVSCQPNADIPSSTQPIFQTPTTQVWTSFLFRTQVLYPALVAQQTQGDGFLMQFTGPNAIPQKFWSLNSYRWGACPHAQRDGTS